MEPNIFQMLLEAKIGPLPLLVVLPLLMFGIPAIAVGFSILRYNKKNKDK